MASCTCCHCREAHPYPAFPSQSAGDQHPAVVPGTTITAAEYIFSLDCSNNNSPEHHHHLCVSCFSKLSAERGCKPYLSCPQCNCRVTSWSINRVVRTKRIVKKVIEPTGRRLRSNRKEDATEKFIMREEEEEEIRQISSHSIESPSIQSNPQEYHESLSIAKDLVTLSMTIPNSDKATTNDSTRRTLVIATGLELNLEPDEMEKMLQSEPLERMFSVLHTIILGKNPRDDELNGLEQYGSIAGKSSLDEFIKDKSTILLRCLYALATGHLFETSLEGKRWDNQRAKVFAAADILRNVPTQSMGVLKRITGKVLLANPVPKSVQNILNKFGAAPSTQYARLKDFDACYERFLAGLGELDPHDVYLILFDNIGYRRKPGFVQFIAIQLLRIRKERLEEKNLYRKNINASAACQTRKDWNEIKGDTEFEDVMKADAADIMRFTKSVLAPISLILKLESEKKLPTMEDCYELCKLGKNFEWPTKIPEELGSRKIIEKEGSTPFQTVACELEDEDIPEDIVRTDCDFDNMYDRNDVTVDRPMCKDLNSRQANLELMNYANLLIERVRDAPIKDERWKNREKLVDYFGVGLLGDGNPVYIMNNLQKKNREKYKRLRAFFGGFHLMLEIHRKRGSLFAASHLEDVFSSWRTTEGQLRWVMNPGDPRQMNAELVPYSLALQTATIRALVAMGRTNLSAKDLIDHWNQRAEQWPIIKKILDEARYGQVLFMLQEAEKKSDVDMFVSAVKLAVPLFAGTHATKYVNMATQFLVDWYCMSEADKIYFAEFILTRKTAHGYNVYSDLFVEIMVKDFRMKTGHVDRGHIESQMEAAAMNLVDTKKAQAFGSFEIKSEGAKREAQERKAGKAKVKELNIDHVFIETLIFATEANLFGEGPPRHLKKGPARKFFENGVRFDYEYDRDEFTQICNKKTKLNIQSLRARSIGKERTEAYFNHFFVAGDEDETGRSEKEVKLTLIDPLMSEKDKSSNKELVRSTSTDSSVLEANYTIDELKYEVDQINDLLSAYEAYTQRELPRGSMRKNDWCHHLKALRQDMIQLNPSWENDTIVLIRRDMGIRFSEEILSLRRILQDEMKDPFFTLDEDEKAKQVVYSFANDTGNNREEFHCDDVEQDEEDSLGDLLVDETRNNTFPTGGGSNNRDSLGMSALDLSFDWND